jgi:hypothetical protein
VSLSDLLKSNRQTIAENWFDLIADSFPEQAHKFIKEQKDRFRNPIGHTFRENTALLLTGIIDNCPVQELAKPLEAIVKIQAVQESTASQSVQFVFLLKQAVRDQLKRQNNTPDYGEWCEFELQVDRLAMAAFECYMTCKEKIYDIRAREISSRNAKLMERLNQRFNAAD